MAAKNTNKKVTTPKIAAKKAAAKPPVEEDSLAPDVDDEQGRLFDDDGPAQVTSAGQQEVESDDPLDELKQATVRLSSVQGATITVNKIGERGEERCRTFTPAEFDESAVQRQYGAGTYVIYAHCNGRLWKKFRLTFAQPIGGGARESLVASPGSHEVLELMRQQVSDFKSLVVQLVNQKNVTREVSSGSDGQIGETMRVLELLKSSFDIFGKQQKSAGSGGEIDILLRGLEMGRNIERRSARGEENPGWVDGIFHVLDRYFSQPPQPRLPPGELNGPEHPGPGAVAEPNKQPGIPSEVGGDSMQQIIGAVLGKVLPALVRGALAGTEPTVYAQLLLDQLPDAYQGFALRFLKNEQWFDDLVRIHASLSPHREWMTQVRDAVVGALEEAGNPSPGSGGEGGH